MPFQKIKTLQDFVTKTSERFKGPLTFLSVMTEVFRQLTKMVLYRKLFFTNENISWSYSIGFTKKNVTEVRTEKLIFSKNDLCVRLCSICALLCRNRFFEKFKIRARKIKNRFFAKTVKWQNSKTISCAQNLKSQSFSCKNF